MLFRSDVELADVLTFAGAFLLHLRADPGYEVADVPDEEVERSLREHIDPTPPSAAPIARALSQLVDELGVSDTFDFLRTRYLEHHNRRVYLTPEPVVRMMLELGGPARTVLDPACGTGAYLNSANDLFDDVELLLGQEIDETTARMTATQLALRGAPRRSVQGTPCSTTPFPDGRSTWSRPTRPSTTADDE